MQKPYLTRAATRRLRTFLISAILGIELCAHAHAQDAAPTTPASLSPALQEIVKLSQAQMADDVIVSYIKHSGKAYPLTADEIIALKGQGLSQTVISALLETKPIGSVPPGGVPPQPSGPGSPQPAAGRPAAMPNSTAPPPPLPLAGGSQPLVTYSQPSAVPTSAPPAPAPTAAGPDGAVSLEYFHAELAPYGTWVDVPGYGQCWSPTRVIAATPAGDWRPYYDNGHWVYTENGWFWVSDYSWGDIPFHYGRWIRQPGYGWLWVPDLTWGPAWVCWREAEADGYIGWAPLPYGAVWVDGGWHYHGHAVVAVGFDFGLGEDYFVFVGHDHFHDHYFRYRSRVEYPFFVRREVVHGFYGRTALRNEFRRDEHGRFVNEGLGRAHVERVTGRKIEVARFDERHPAVRAEHSAAPASGSTGAASHANAAPAASEASKIYRPPATSTAARQAPPARAAAKPGTTSKQTAK